MQIALWGANVLSLILVGKYPHMSLSHFLVHMLVKLGFSSSFGFRLDV